MLTLTFSRRLRDEKNAAMERNINKIDAQKQAGILQVLDNTIEEMKRDGKYSSVNNYTGTRRRFARFLSDSGHDDLALSQVDKKVIDGFNDRLTADGVGQAAGSVYLHILRMVLKRAAQQGYVTVYDKAEDPFADIKIVIVRKVQHQVYGSETLRSLRSLDLEKELVASGRKAGNVKFGQRLEALQMARDLFLFSFCTYGMDFNDICHLKKTDISDGWITYTRRKTGLEVKVKIHPMAQEVMNRWPSKTIYVFPLLKSASKERTYREYKTAIDLQNKMLGMLSKMLGGGVSLKTVSAKESWAVLAYESGMPLPQITKAMGYTSDMSKIGFLGPLLRSDNIEDCNDSLLDSIFE